VSAEHLVSVATGDRAGDSTCGWDAAKSEAEAGQKERCYPTRVEAVIAAMYLDVAGQKSAPSHHPADTGNLSWRR